MPLDSSIPLQSNAPDPMVSLNSMLDMGTKSLSLAKNRATFDADVARSKAESSTAQSGAEVNRANIQQLIRQQAAQTSSAQSKAQVDQANVNPLIQEQAAKTQTAQLGAGNAAVDLNTKKTQNAVQAVQSLMQDPNLNAQQGQPYSVEQGQKTVRGVLRYMEDTGQDQDKIEKMRGPLNEAVKTQGGVVEWLKGQLRTGLTPQDNAGLQNPSNQYVNDSASIRPVSGNGMAPGFNRSSTQQPIPVQLPPTTPTYGGPNGTTPGVKGPVSNPGASGLGSYNDANQAGQAAANDVTSQIFDRQTERKQQAAQGNTGNVAALDREIARLSGKGNTAGNPSPAAPGFFQTGLPQGQEANLKDNTEAMNAHFAKISAMAENAPLVSSLVSNIKSLANGAITGTLQGRTAYVTGLLNSVNLGNKITGDLQKDTDLLEKYMAQLNLTTPAATNAMREIITAGRPHGTMIKGALTDAADQFGSLFSAALATRDHLRSYKFSNGGKGDPIGYDTEKMNMEHIADPLIFQMQGKTRDEIKAYMAKLPIADQQELVRKSGLLDKMGITK